MFAFAGLWDRWRGPEGDEIESYAILTTEPNELVRPVHDRMPVIVSPENYEFWLDPAVQDVALLRPIFRPFPGDELAAYPVGTRVNDPASDDPSYIEALV